jgi:phosphoglycolate phosphatase-like HAD superfamily hydrolase
VRISFDMDGVLADMDGALARIAEQEFGVTTRLTFAESGADAESAGGGGAERGPDDRPAGYDTAVLANLSPRQQSRLWQRCRATRNFWETLDECEPGIVRRLQKVARELGWDVLFVTQRPSSAGRPVQVQTQHWLRHHGFEYPAVYTTIGSRGAIAAALTLDVHVDDRLQHCVDVATESKAWPILVWRDTDSSDRLRAGAANLGIAVVATMSDALDKIAAADRPAPAQTGQPSLLERLRRAFS